MKKITAFIAALAFMSAFTSCNSNDKKGSGGSMDAINLQMQLKPGDHFGYSSLMDMDLTTAGMGLKIKMDMGTDFEVISASPAGKELKLTYTRVKMTTNIGTLTPTIMDSAMQKASDAIKEKTLILVLSPDNKIIEVKGIDSAFIASKDEQTRLILNSTYSKEQMNNAFGMIFGLYPNKPVKPGDSWQTENAVALSAVQMTLKTTYTLKEVKDGIATIDLQGTVDGKANMKRGTVVNEMPINGKQSGSMQVKATDGRLQDGKVTMEVNTQIPANGMSLPMTIKMVTETKGS